MTPTNIKHAVFQTSRRGDGGATVQIVGPFGSFSIAVPAAGNAERLTQAQTVEALRNALAAMGEAAERLEEHLRHVDPEGHEPEKPKQEIPLTARFA